jgi:UDP-N-acetylglucosamine 4,6-dehydratase
MFDNQTVLITGGTGSWGHELVEQLLMLPVKKIIVFSRNESKQVQLRNKFSDGRLVFIIGDVRDKDALMKACEGVDYLFHLAALKHVPICEYQPLEAIKTNITGTQHVIEAAIHHRVKKVVNISTDKAASPSNLYGMTKAVGEKLFVTANLLESETKFICVRGGNVLGSNGSVIHIFKEQIQSGKPVGITNKNMTRFFLTLKDSIALLLRGAEIGQGGEILVMTMPTCKIKDLAEVLAESLGEKNVSFVETGIRPGEKLHELLLSEHESDKSVMYDDQYIVILPTIQLPGLKSYYAGKPPVQIETFSSADNLMSKEEISLLLKKGGFIS